MGDFQLVDYTKTYMGNLLSNTRFYILAFSFLLSLAVLAGLRLAFSTDQLWLIRSQEVFGFIAIGFWYLALIISPIGAVIGKKRIKHLEFARRAIGVSAFYFALLHTIVALWGQLGGIGEITHLPDLFQWSLIGGAGALFILLLMALTSFDRVVQFMTYRKWKWLHRFVYAAGVLVILHIWTIGTHLAYSPVQLISFIALVILSGLELFRVTKRTNEKYFHLEKAEASVLFIASWAIVSLLIALIPVVVENYHSRHLTHDHTSAVEIWSNVS